jgi:hypothetical protein
MHRWRGRRSIAISKSWRETKAISFTAVRSGAAQPGYAHFSYSIVQRHAVWVCSRVRFNKQT